jgi:hypothetical protein
MVEAILQPPAYAGSSLADFSTLKMEIIRSSETSVHTRSTWRHIPEDGIRHRRENLKSYINFICYCDNFVRIATAYGFDSRQEQDFSLLHSVQTESGAHSTSFPSSTRVFFTGAKAAGS